jgi:plastocyanin
MRREKGRAAAAQGLLTALLVVAGMMVVAYATVALSDSQQFPAQQPEAAGSQASGTNASETSLPVANQTTTARPGAPSPETTFVKILLGSADSVSYSFSPLQVTVVIGVNNTVNWVNDDNAAHTVTAKDGSFSSGNMASGSTYTYTFTTPGTFTYYCAYHSWMVATVVVKAG